MKIVPLQERRVLIVCEADILHFVKCDSGSVTKPDYYYHVCSMRYKILNFGKTILDFQSCANSEKKI